MKCGLFNDPFDYYGHIGSGNGNRLHRFCWEELWGVGWGWNDEGWHIPKIRPQSVKCGMRSKCGMRCPSVCVCTLSNLLRMYRLYRKCNVLAIHIVISSPMIRGVKPLKHHIWSMIIIDNIKNQAYGIKNFHTVHCISSIFNIEEFIGSIC